MAWESHSEKEMIIDKVIFEISQKNDVHNNNETDYRPCVGTDYRHFAPARFATENGNLLLILHAFRSRSSTLIFITFTCIFIHEK